MKFINAISLLISMVINQLFTMDISVTDNYNQRQYQILSLAKNIKIKKVELESVNLNIETLVKQIKFINEDNDESQMLGEQLSNAFKKYDKIGEEIGHSRATIAGLITVDLFEENFDHYFENRAALEQDRMEIEKSLEI